MQQGKNQLIIKERKKKGKKKLLVGRFRTVANS